MKKKPFEKYYYYEHSVQNPDVDIDFINRNFKKAFGKYPTTLREDFCGTGFLSYEWVKQSPRHRSYGVDLSPEPVLYGIRTHAPKLTGEEQSRAIFYRRNVLTPFPRKTDVVTALNFSYLTFRERHTMVEYFRTVRKGLKQKGLFYLDLLGGPESQEVIEEKTRFRKFTYFWDCTFFDAITNEAHYEIHFKRDGERKRKAVFRYIWRLYGVQEIVDCLSDAGFKKPTVHWEDEKGVFRPKKSVENFPGWVVCITALA